MSDARVLFVDDEPNIRVTMPAILEMHGFEVTTTATVAEALAAMQTQKFDVLIADLNIGQPGDGFTVVSAMRRTQPEAVTIILTGYPAFETALQAIRSQVDDYVVKPANVKLLVGMIEEKLRTHAPTRHIASKRTALILGESKEAILEEWLRRCKEEPELLDVSLSDRERVDHLPQVINELIRALNAKPGNELSEKALQAASEHGRLRRRQDYTIPMILAEARLLRRVIYGAIQENLLALDISFVISDMIVISDKLDEQMRYSIEEYIRGSMAA